MSNNQWVNIGIAVVVGIATWGIGTAVGMAAYAGTAGLLAFSATSSILNGRIKAKTPLMRPGSFMGNSGETQSRGDAAAAGLNIASSSEAITIPVVFGTCRMGTNIIGYDPATFRATAVFEQVPRDPSQVAYDLAKKKFKSSPGTVDYIIDSAARKNQPSGGKGGGDSQPTPSDEFNNEEKITAYANVLLEKDRDGKKKLPVEYDQYQTGWRYNASYELGICMGPVDALQCVRSYPGESIVIDNFLAPDITTDMTVFTARGAEEGGSMRIYRGGADQERNAADVYYQADGFNNYRNVCFAVLENYYIGPDEAPPSHAFEVTRFPRLVDADGDPIPVEDFPVRGAAPSPTTPTILAAWAAKVLTVTIAGENNSPAAVDGFLWLEGFTTTKINGRRKVVTVTNDGTNTLVTFAVPTNPGAITIYGTVRLDHHEAYYDANPAAILWEVFTDKIWGRGLSASTLDQVSFQQAAVWFYANKVGMSFSLDAAAPVSDIVETIRSHVCTVIIWDNDRLVCRCLLDRANAYSPRIRINSRQVVENSVRYTAPTWSNNPNELRGEFLDRANNYQPRILSVQDLGAINTVNRINSEKMSLPAFSNQDTAARMLRAQLAETAFPRASVEFVMNRFESRLRPSDFFQFDYGEFSPGLSSTFWRVTEMDDGDPDGDNEGIKVTAAADTYATPTTSPDDVFEIPVPAYEGQHMPTASDIDLGPDLDAPFDSGNYGFFFGELSIFQSDGDRQVAFVCQRTGAAAGLRLYWRVNGSGGDYAQIYDGAPWGILATLQTTMDARRDSVHRDDVPLTLKLRLASERARFLEYCSTAPTDADALDKVLSSETNYLRIGNELLQVMQAEAGMAADEVVLTAYSRSMLGTEFESHTIGTACAFTYQFLPGAMTFRYEDMPVDTLLDFRAIPYNLRGDDGETYDFTFTITNLARKALRVERWEVSKAGSDWTINFRPRCHAFGADSEWDFEEAMNTYVGAIQSGYQFYVMPRNSGGTALLADPVAVSPTFTPDGQLITDGMASFIYTVPGTTDHVTLYQSFDGILGLPSENIT